MASYVVQRDFYKGYKMKKLYVFLATIFCLGVMFESAAYAQPTGEAKATRFRVEVTGHGRPMILVPGLNSSGKVWDSTVAKYKGKYQCHVLTLAGFAGQPAAPGPFLESQRVAIADYIRAKKLVKPVIVGHSLGGFLALWLASREPDLVGPLVIVDSLPFFGGAAQPSATVESIRPQAEAMRRAIQAPAPPEERKRAQLATMQSMISDPANVEIGAKWSADSDQNTSGQALYELFTTDIRSEISNIKSPTLVIGTWIAYKQYASREQIEANFRSQYGKLPNYTLVMADKSRHFVMFDDPSFLFHTMDSFLNSH
jgi:N-formylmaleamate deformylase